MGLHVADLHRRRVRPEQDPALGAGVDLGLSARGGDEEGVEAVARGVADGDVEGLEGVVVGLHLGAAGDVIAEAAEGLLLTQPATALSLLDDEGVLALIMKRESAMQPQPFFLSLIPCPMSPVLGQEPEA